MFGIIMNLNPYKQQVYMAKSSCFHTKTDFKINLVLYDK